MSDSHAADVQAELQQYLNSKNINSLFIAIVESLLIEKPANPIAFMIEYLHKQYPEQAKLAMEGISRYSSGAKGVESEAKSEMKSAGKAESKSNLKAESKSGPSRGASSKGDRSDEDTEDDDEDAMGDMVVKVSVNAVAVGRRRVSVSAESMDPAKLKNQRSLLVVVDKSPEVTDRLLMVVGKSPLLKMLDEEQKDMIVKAFTGPILKEAGETIIQQGDIGDVFYLLESGFVDVHVRKKGDDAKKVHTYKSGDAFGELALMYNAPRAATCIARDDCKLWALDRTSFRVIVVAAAMQKRETYQGFLSCVPILQTLTDNEIMTLADALIEETYCEGDVICTQGDEGDYFYIVKTGTAVCYQVDAEGENKVVATLNTGNYFGEIALLTTKPRQATVKASGSLNVLALHRSTFTRVFGNLDEMMKRNMEEYNKYAASELL